MGYKCMTNKSCEYYPCHKLAEDIEFNCLFCYCPLYALGKDCGGNYRYTAKGIKDCSNCTLPHRGEQGWQHVINNIGKIIERTKAVQPIKLSDDKNDLIC